MSIDLEKLTPAPWSVEVFPSCVCDIAREWPCVFGPPVKMWHPDVDAVSTPRLARELHGKEVKSPVAMNCNDATADAEFIVLARNWLDVQLRRGWGVKKAWPAKEWLLVSHLDNTIFGPWHSLLELLERAVEYDAELTAEAKKAGPS